MRLVDERLYRTLVEASPQALALVRLDDGRLTFASPAMEVLTGHSEAELLALGPDRLEALVHAEDRACVAEAGGRLRVSDAPVRADFRVVRRDGSILWVHGWAGRVAVAEGEAVLLTLRDDTERRRAEEALRESEQRLRAAHRLANLGAWSWDVRTGEVEWSDGVYAIFGLDPATFTPQIDSILALSPWPEDNERDKELIQRAIESRGPGSYEQRFLRPDGSTGYYASTFIGEYDDAGALVGMQGTVQDITASKLAEQERVHLVERLHQAQRMESIGRLAGGIAHDFNNMLCAIIGHVELALDDASVPHDLRVSLGDALGAAQRATSLTRQLLAFSRKQIIEPRVVDLGELVEGLHPMLARLIGEDVVLRTVHSEGRGRVRVDPGLVEQIVLNLVVNARDAIPGGGEVHIETTNVDLDEEYCARHGGVEPGSYVMLAVSDDGVGIPAEIRDKIFEPFFTTKQLGRGTGLGLATVFGIVQQNNGRIEVYSEPGHGTTFKVYFRRVFDELDAPRERHASPSLDGTETVLVVEDEGAVRTAAVQMLERRGYTALAAASGEEALSAAAQHEGSVDLLLTDVVMPGMNGRELATRLQQTRPQVKVLYTSGYTDNVIAHHGILDRGLHFISKPYSLEVLATRVREILDSSSEPYEAE